MAIIGTFTAHGDTFAGTIKTVTLNIKTTLVPAEKETDKAPDYRAHGNTVEFGAAWKKTSRDGRNYLSVKFDDPSFPGPIYASLMESDVAGEYSLIWAR